MATMTKGKQGWEKTCDCGFQVRDYNKAEMVSIINTHVKMSHNMGPLPEAEALKGAKPISM